MKGNVNYRIGYEIYRLASRISTEPASNQLRFNDFGIGLGIEIDYYLNKNFSIGFSTDYKYFLFKEYELSYPTYWPVNLFYNPSIVFFSLSASYTFYKKQKPEYFDNK